MAQDQLFFLGVKGLIQNARGELLLLLADVSKHRKTSTPYWDILGGRLQEGSDVITTLKREIQEETSITKVDNVTFFTAVVSNHEIPYGSDKLAGLVLMIYKVSIPENSHIQISAEHSAYEWVPKAEAKVRLQHKYPAEFTDSL